MVHDPQSEIRYPVVYKMTTGSQIASWILGLFFGTCGVGLLMFLLQGSFDPIGYAFLGGIALCLLAVSVYCIAYAMQGSLTLEAQAIEIRKAFITRRLQRSEILGRRITQGRSASYPVIVPRTGASITIERSTFGLDDRFSTWFNALPDLDAQERAEALAMVERDASLGSSAQERLATLEKAKQAVKVLNLLPMGLLFWSFVYPRPYAAIIACAAVLPWVAVVLTWAKPGLFQLDGKKGDVRPNLAMLLIMPPLVLAMRALLDVTLIDFRQLFLWGFVLGMPLCVAVFAAPKASSKATTKPWALPLLMLPFMMAYGCGLLALTDAMWDSAKPEVFRTAVTGKDISHGKTTTYYLHLAPWSKTIDEDRISVPHAYYEAVDKADVVCVRLHPGKFGLRWMQVGPCG
ncbi:hypothetical protein B0E46_12440 [Rhodanobacter sp. B04]|nr:hypothetical protein B0E46_12440 [Rhodanobacter sp. B04]